MSLFRRQEPESVPARPTVTRVAAPSGQPAGESAGASGARQAATFIASGSRIQGELSGSTEVLIEGEVEGDVRSAAGVVVGRTGVVRGPLTARVARIEGRVEGNVRAAERIEVAASGHVEGDIAAPRVLIAEGAYFKGRVDMKSPQAEGGAVKNKGNQ